MTPHEIDLLTQVLTRVEDLVERFDRNEKRVTSRLDRIEAVQSELDKKIAVINVKAGFLGTIAGAIVALGAFAAQWVKGTIGGS